MGKYDSYAICPFKVKDEHKQELIKFLMSLLKDSRYIQFKCAENKREDVLKLQDIFGEVGLSEIQTEWEYGNYYTITVSFIETLGKLLGESEE